MTNEEGQEYYNETMPLSKGAAPISDERLAEIEVGLEGVTPGPWGHFVTKNGYGEDAVQFPNGQCAVLRGDSAEMSLDAAHIARCDPDTIRTLIARIRIAEAEHIGIQTYVDALHASQTERDALRAHVETLREALRPFAAVRGYTCVKDDGVAGIDFCRRIPRWMKPGNIIKAGDFRRARAALAATQPASPAPQP